MSINNNINIIKNKIAFSGQQNKNKKTNGALTVGVGLIAGTGIGAGFNRLRFSEDKAEKLYTQKLTEQVKDFMEKNKLDNLEIKNGEFINSSLDNKVKKGFEHVSKCFTNLIATRDDGNFKISEKNVLKETAGKVVKAETESQKICNLSAEGISKAMSVYKTALLKTGAIYGAIVGFVLGAGAALKISLKRKRDAAENIPSQAISMK